MRHLSANLNKAEKNIIFLFLHLDKEYDASSALHVPNQGNTEDLLNNAAAPYFSAS